MNRQSSLRKQATLTLNGDAGPQQQASLTKKQSSLSKKASLTKSASNASTASVNRTTSRQSSVMKTVSVTKVASVTKQTSLTKKTTVTKQTSVKRLNSTEKQPSVKRLNSTEKQPIVKRLNSTEKQPSIKQQPSLKKKQTSIKPRPLSIKRERKAVKRFDPDDEPKPKPGQKRPKAAAREIAYDKGEFLAARAEGGVFYLCQAAQNVYEDNTIFRIRWLEIENPPNTYKMAYEDSIELDTIIGSVKLQRPGKGLLVLRDSELQRVETLLKAAETGEDAENMDAYLFAPLLKKKKAEPKATEKKDKATKKKKVPTATLR